MNPWVFHLYKEEERGLAGHIKAALDRTPPSLPNPSTTPSSTSLLHGDGEALHEISTTTATTLSCCRDSEEDLLLLLPAGTGRRTSSSTPNV